MSTFCGNFIFRGRLP